MKISIVLLVFVGTVSSFSLKHKRGGGSCVDKIPNCQDYTEPICTDPLLTQWRKEYCPKFCGECGAGAGAGCLYNGHVYQQGERWKVGCQYSCQCLNGTSGVYSCSELCLNWKLPTACHLIPPATGKCCPTPKCPSGYILQYPVG